VLPPSAFRDRGAMVGPHLRLEPLAPRHADDLVAAASDPEIFRYLRYAPANSPERMRELMETFARRRDAGTDLPFAIVRGVDGVAVGMTRYLAIDRENATVEIGGTWMAPALWGSVVNPESKRLLLARAFEEERANRVQIKTDLRNLRSQRAIEKLGAVREGVLRHDAIMPDGFLRSSVYYSILTAEWPAVRDRLDARIARAPVPWAGPTRAA